MKAKFHLLSIIRLNLKPNNRPNNVMNFGNAQEKPVIVYTDGSCRNEKCGVGVHFPSSENCSSLELSESVKHHRSTNQVAELTACIRAIETAKEKNIKHLLIRTDSQYVVKSMKEWIHKWKLNNWKTTQKSDVKNRDLMEKLDKLCSALKVEWEYIPRDQNKVANDLAQKITETDSKKGTSPS